MHRITRLFSAKKAKGGHCFGFSTQRLVAYGLEAKLLSWDHLLTEEERGARALTREWLDTRFQEWALQGERNPRDLAIELAALGGFGNETHAGKSMSAIAKGLMFQLYEHTFNAVKLKQCKIEPADEGSAMIARKQGDHFILNGVKNWVVAAPLADLAVVWAQVEEDSSIKAFVIERSEGMLTPYIAGPFTSGICSMGEVHLKDCIVAAEQELIGANGLTSALSCLLQSREAAAWGITGAAIACFEACLRLGDLKLEQDTQLPETQVYQNTLADMAAEIVKSQLMSLHYARCSDMQQLTPLQVNFLKRSNLSSALKVAICTRSLLGKQLHLDSCPVKHHIRNIEFLAVLDGDASLHAAAIANALVDPSDCQ